MFQIQFHCHSYLDISLPMLRRVYGERKNNTPLVVAAIYWHPTGLLLGHMAYRLPIGRWLATEKLVWPILENWLYFSLLELFVRNTIFIIKFCK